MRAPFAYYGCKSLIASKVWSALGDVPLFIEPFAGSLAIPLAREHPPRREILNDCEGHVVNFWRAIRTDALGVWRWAHDPCSELDVHARHRWRHGLPDLRPKLARDPNFCDVQAAGWWAWGLSAWIGGTASWCRLDKPLYLQVPQSAPRGIFSWSYDDLVWLGRRLARVQLLCGDWRRVVSRAYTTGLARPVGVFLDPPYSEGADGLYASHDKSLSAQVRAWAIEHGDDPQMRIVLCGYEGEHVLPKSWRKVAWKSRRGNANAGRERLWISPHCLTGTKARKAKAQ